MIGAGAVTGLEADAGLGMGGTGVLSVNGEEVARNTLEHTIPITFPEDETFDVGLDTRTGGAMFGHLYDSPFRFTGTIDKVTVELDPAKQGSGVTRGALALAAAATCPALTGLGLACRPAHRTPEACTRRRCRAHPGQGRDVRRLGRCPPLAGRHLSRRAFSCCRPFRAYGDVRS
jgi:hypothetical protein